MTVSTTEQEPRSLSRRRPTVIGHWLRSKAAGYAFLALIGVAMIAVGISVIIHNHHLVQTGVRTTGVVVGNDVSHERNGTTYYYPRVRYVVLGNHTYVETGSGRANPPEYRVGQNVTVYYDRQHPQMADVASASMDADAWSIIKMGCVLVLIGACPLVWWRLRGTSSSSTRSQCPGAATCDAR
jgi:Protein of unknown function (DUF3592)